LSLDQIRAGLTSFRNAPDQNLGRLNVFELAGVTAIMDFAHNEIGLDLLLDFSRHFVKERGKLFAIIGTAGDRTAHSLQELGRISATKADVTIIKGTKKYLRGRENDEMIALYQAGVRSMGANDAPVLEDEVAALEFALEQAKPGDVIAIMCQEYMNEIHARLSELGKPLS
jgi:cyanophycin synthetase